MSKNVLSEYVERIDEGLVFSRGNATMYIPVKKDLFFGDSTTEYLDLEDLNVTIRYGKEDEIIVSLKDQKRLNDILDLERIAQACLNGRDKAYLPHGTISGKLLQGIRRDHLYNIKIAKTLTVKYGNDGKMHFAHDLKGLKSSMFVTLIKRGLMPKTYSLIKKGDLVPLFINVSNGYFSYHSNEGETVMGLIKRDLGLVTIGGGSGLTRGLFVNVRKEMIADNEKAMLRKVRRIAKIVCREMGTVDEVFEKEGLNSKALFKTMLLANRTGMVNDSEKYLKLVAILGVGEKGMLEGRESELEYEDGLIFRTWPNRVRAITKEIGLNESPALQVTLIGDYLAKGMVTDCQTDGELDFVRDTIESFGLDCDHIDGYINLDQVFGDAAIKATPGDIINLRFKDIMIVNSIIDNRQSASTSQQFIQYCLVQNEVNSEYIFETNFKDTIERHFAGAPDSTTPPGRAQLYGFPHDAQYSIMSTMYRVAGALRGANKGTTDKNSIGVGLQVVLELPSAHLKNCKKYAKCELDAGKTPNRIIFCGPEGAKSLGLITYKEAPYNSAEGAVIKPPVSMTFNNTAECTMVVLPWIEGHTVLVSTNNPYIIHMGNDGDGDALYFYLKSWYKNMLRKDITLNSDLPVLTEIRVPSHVIYDPTVEDLIYLGDRNYSSSIGLAETAISKIDDCINGRALITRRADDPNDRGLIYSVYTGASSIHDMLQGVMWMQSDIDGRKKFTDFVPKFVDTKPSFLQYGKSIRQVVNRYIKSMKRAKRLDTAQSITADFIKRVLPYISEDTVLGISMRYVTKLIMSMKQLPTKWVLNGFTYAGDNFIQRPNLSDSINDIATTAVPLGYGKLMLKGLVEAEDLDDAVDAFGQKVPDLLNSKVLIDKLVGVSERYREIIKLMHEVNLQIDNSNEELSQDQLDDLVDAKNIHKSKLNVICVAVNYLLNRYAADPAIDLAVWTVGAMFLDNNLWFRIAPPKIINALSVAYWELRNTGKLTHTNGTPLPPKSSKVELPKETFTMRNDISYEIWTDGSCHGNPGPAGAGAVFKKYVNSRLVAHRVGRWFVGSKSTNNIAELFAVSKALSFVQDKDAEITVYSDSAYVVRGINEWLDGWKSRGWRTTSKTRVKNVIQWKKLDEVLIDMPNVTFKKVDGHTGIEENEEADALANAAVDMN